MSAIILVRHGQASWGSENYDRLSELGRRQATVLGESLRHLDRPPTLLVHGGLERQRDTATLVRDAAGWAAPVREDPAFREFDHQHLLEVHGEPPAERTLSAGDRMTRWIDIALPRWVSGEFDHEYDEHFEDFRDRVMDGVRRLADELGRGESAYVFSSSGVMAAVVSTLLGGTGRQWEQLNQVAANTGVTRVVSGRRGLTLISFNEHGHLGRDLLTYR